MTEKMPPILSDAIAANGIKFQTEAREVRSAEFSGVFHLLAVGDRLCNPPLVVIAPGKWRDENNAHQAAQRHALTMADDGALSVLLESLRRI